MSPTEEAIEQRVEAPTPTRETASARQLDFALASPDFSRPNVKSERGGLMGMALGIKPAIAMDSGLVEKLAPLARSSGIDVITHGNFLVNKKALEKRVQEEAELAAEVGWDSQKSIPENLQAVTTIGTDSVEDQLRAGFVLGYPATAIREYREFKKAGVPILQDFWRAVDFPEEATKLKLDMEIPVVAAAFQTITQERQRTVQTMAGVGDASVRNKLCEELAARTREPVLYLLKNYFKESFTDGSLTPEQAADMYSRVVDIRSPGGDHVYTFNVYTKEASSAPDILALKNRVLDAFATAGLE